MLEDTDITSQSRKRFLVSLWAVEQLCFRVLGEWPMASQEPLRLDPFPRARAYAVGPPYVHPEIYLKPGKCCKGPGRKRVKPELSGVFAEILLWVGESLTGFCLRCVYLGFISVSLWPQHRTVFGSSVVQTGLPQWC